MSLAASMAAAESRQVDVLSEDFAPAKVVVGDVLFGIFLAAVAALGVYICLLQAQI